MLICKDKFYLEGSHSISIRDKIAHKLCSNKLIVKAIDKNKFKNSKLIKNKKTNLSSTDNKA